MRGCDSILELEKNVELKCQLGLEVPEDPCMVMVYPTNGLEEEQVRLSKTRPLHVSNILI